MTTNQLITLTLSKEIESEDGDTLATDYSSYFTTSMDPLFASANDVRRRIGAHITRIIDDTINQLNFHHSLMAINTTICEDTATPKWLYFANKWVTLMTALVLLDNGDAFVGQVSKVLGDFEVTRQGPATAGTKFTDLIKRLECELFKIENPVRNCGEPLTACTDEFTAPTIGSNYMPSVPAIFSRGIDEPNYPPIGRRWVRTNMPIATDRVKAFGKWYKTRLC